MRALIAAAAILAATPLNAQTSADRKPDRTADVSIYGMDYGQTRYSELGQIDKNNVKRLVPIWNLSLDDNRGVQAQPIIVGRTMYVTTHESTVAIDALSGRQLWKHKVDYQPEDLKYVCCGLNNRGVAVYKDKVYRSTLDDHLIALDQKTGKEIWNQKVAEIRDGISMTAAPMIADGVLVTGMAGADMGVRGFLDGWDPETGKHLWRFNTVPDGKEKGADTWLDDHGAFKRGGASTWVTGSYDPKLGLMYWGTGNAGPWNALFRPGDNLFTSSVLALRPRTGELVWYYQFSPNDAFDYDSVNEMILTDAEVGGESRPVILHADKNGFFYVLDRRDGKLLAANKFAKVTWADGIDMKSGRPILSEANRKMRETGEGFELWPSAMGAKNWPPMSYSPKSKLAFFNTLNVGWFYKPIEPKYKDGTLYLGTEFKGWKWPDGPKGGLMAFDPFSGKTAWEVPLNVPNFAGTFVTSTDLLFVGTLTGEFQAYDALSGKKLWSFQTGSGITGQPITWQYEGRQYVTVPSGLGGGYALYSGDEGLRNVPAGDSIWTFALQPQ